MQHVSSVSILALTISSLLPQGCRAEHASTTEVGARTQPAWLSAVSAHSDIAQWRKGCKESGGSWSDGLLSCQCQPGKLFDVAGGCVRVARKQPADVAGCGDLAQGSREDLQRCAADLLELPSMSIHLDTGELSDSEVKRIGEQLDKDWTAPLRGTTITSQKTTHRNLLLLVGDKAASIEWQPWLTAGGCAGRFNTSSVNPIRALRAPMPADEARKHCVGLMAAGGDEDRQAGDAMCQAVTTFVLALSALDEAEPFTWAKAHYARNGTGCIDGGSALAVNARIGAIPLTYNVALQDGVPVLRLIAVPGPDESALYAFLAPTGRVEGYALVRHKAAGGLEDHLLETEYTAFDDRARALQHEVTERGNRAELRAVAATTHDTFALLPLDGRADPSFAPISALIIDSGIDPRVPGLAERLGVTSTDDRPAFAYSRDQPIGSLLDILDDEGHGTRMAVIVAADLPGVKLHLLRAAEVAAWGPGAALLHRWEQVIRQTRSRVVNISCGFTQDVADCDAFFGALFADLPGVLFVVGAGNDGSRNSVDACPSSLAFRHGNVLTVAGSDAGQRRLAEHSSYGRDVAKVAAPYWGDSISTQPTRQALGEVVVTQQGGTSISAALVSNAALRLLARHPRITAQQLVRAFMKTCTRSNLDVACEGEVSFERLERYLR